MFKLTILVTGILSFLYFAFPQSFSLEPKIGDVLGIKQIETTANSQVTRLAVTIYCINNGILPDNLNKLYENELSKNKFLDLDKMYTIKPIKDCDFELISNG